MTITFQPTAKFADYLGDGSINFNTADLRLAPTLNAHTFSTAHDFADDITNEVTTLGGTRVALTGESWALAGAHGRFDCDDPAWLAAGGPLTIRKAVLLDYTGSSSDADREYLGLFTFDADAVAGDGTQVKMLTPNGLIEVRTSP